MVIENPSKSTAPDNLSAFFSLSFSFYGLVFIQTII